MQPNTIQITSFLLKHSDVTGYMPHLFLLNSTTKRLPVACVWFAISACTRAMHWRHWIPEQFSGGKNKCLNPVLWVKAMQLVSHLVLWAQSTTKDYITVEHKFHSISKSLVSQVIIPLFFFSLFIFRERSTREPASSRVTYFILQAHTRTGVSHSQHRNTQGEV